MEKASGEQFEDIEVWQLARELTSRAYGLTKKVDERKVTLNGEP